MNHRRLHAIVLAWLALAIALGVVTACGRNRENDTDQDAAKEQRAIAIAAQFAQDGDLDRARQALAGLGVPNPAQWLALVAEQYIRERPADEVTAQLVTLAVALDVRTVTLVNYARTHFTPTATPTKEGPPPTPTPTPTPFVAVPTATPTPTPAPPTPTPTPEATPTPFAVVQAQVLNVRDGPSTDYPVIGRLESGDEVAIVGQNDAGDWWQICCLTEGNGWVYGPLVRAQGETAEVPVIVDIAPPPPTATPLPATPTPPPAPAVDFRVVKTRLLSKEENGGCVGMHNIFVTVLDASGAPLNGIRVGRVWVPDDIKVTGADNKGPGKVEFDLFKHGDQVRVLDFSSETTRPLEVEDEKIPIPELIAAGYCSSPEECQDLIDRNRLCRYHYSWEVVFQRTW